MILDDILFPPIADDPPKLSVIVVVKNGLAYLLETLMTISQQSFRDFEVIIIDGASTDGTLEILRLIPNIVVKSSPDHGYHEAFNSGIEIARGRYIIQCCVSDGFHNATWFAEAISYLEENPHFALVWGFPQNLEANGELGEVSFPDFHHLSAPRGGSFYFYWLTYGLHFPEGNLIIHKSVLQKIFPSFDIFKPNYGDLTFDPWLEANFRFHQMGYLSGHVRKIANYGRRHLDSITLEDSKTSRIDLIVSDYISKLTNERLAFKQASRKSFRSVDERLYRVKFQHLQFFISWILVFFLKNARKLINALKRRLNFISYP